MDWWELPLGIALGLIGAWWPRKRGPFLWMEEKGRESARRSIARRDRRGRFTEFQVVMVTILVIWIVTILAVVLA